MTQRLVTSRMKQTSFTISRIEEERRRITKEFEVSYAQTVEEAQQAIAAIQKRCDDQLAVEQARTIRIKTEFEQHQAEVEEKLTRRQCRTSIFRIR